MMNLDLAMAAGYVMAAAGGFALGALTGHWLMAEMRAALDEVLVRLLALEQTLLSRGTAANSASAVPTRAPTQHYPVPVLRPTAAVPAAQSAAPSQAGALDHHAHAVEKLAAAIEKHAQAVDDHGAATVAAAVEMGTHPAVAGPAATFAPSPTHTAGVAIESSSTPVAAIAAATAHQG